MEPQVHTVVDDADPRIGLGVSTSWTPPTSETRLPAQHLLTRNSSIMMNQTSSRHRSRIKKKRLQVVSSSLSSKSLQSTCSPLHSSPLLSTLSATTFRSPLRTYHHHVAVLSTLLVVILLASSGCCSATSDTASSSDDGPSGGSPPPFAAAGASQPVLESNKSTTSAAATIPTSHSSSSSKVGQLWNKGHGSGHHHHHNGGGGLGGGCRRCLSSGNVNPLILPFAQDDLVGGDNNESQSVASSGDVNASQQQHQDEGLGEDGSSSTTNVTQVHSEAPLALPWAAALRSSEMGGEKAQETACKWVNCSSATVGGQVGGVSKGWNGHKKSKLFSLSSSNNNNLSRHTEDGGGSSSSNTNYFSSSTKGYIKGKAARSGGGGASPTPSPNHAWTSSSSAGPETLKSRKSRDQARRDLSARLSSLANMPRGASTGASLVVDSDMTLNTGCDRVFISGKDGLKNGTFESPSITAEDGHSLQCVYLFVAKPNERVEVVFREFHVRGTPPECVHEYVDIYTEVEDMDISDLITTPFSGRYCGKIPPRRRISLYGGIAIGFYTDKNTTEDLSFRGTFSFFSETRYNVGTPVPRTLCSYTIYAKEKRQGDLISPTYPGVYPKDLSCTYKFIGTEQQRLRLEFRDFDLFYGGSHCPFDDVKIYDGQDVSAPLIGTYCGQQRNLVVYSSSNLLLVTFSTLERNTEAQNRGFNAIWEFSESFVKLDFIKKNQGEHIRGSECDQRILSTGTSDGNVYSPNYPFPYLTKIVCRYFIYGLQDPQHLERVRVQFDKFDVPSNAKTIAQSEEDERQSRGGDSTPSKCGDGFLKLFTKQQEASSYDKADFEFCGKDVPADVVSDGPRLVMIFSSGDIQGSGFKARYVFETEYRIPGTAAPDGSCRFSYASSTRKRGEFNSPRFPSNYPSMMNCTYMFLTESSEQVRIVFDHFKIKSDKVNTTGGSYGDHCQEDWIEVYCVFKHREDRLLGRFCGYTSPGPLESEEGAYALRLVFSTDEEGIMSGFKARYIFFPEKPPNGDECGHNITGLTTGVLSSPNWPAQYTAPSEGVGGGMLTCNWFVYARPGSRVMLHFQQFNIEGSPKDRGCPAAAVRVWEDPDGIPMELCGEKLLADQYQYVSIRNVLRLTFILAEKAVGAGGFKAVFTEVQDAENGCNPTQFKCDKSQYCIPKELQCDGEYHCGVGPTHEQDMSDEVHCKVEADTDILLILALGLTGFLSMVLVICIWAHRKRRKRRRRLQLRRPPIHVCDNAGARFAAMDSV